MIENKTIFPHFLSLVPIKIELMFNNVSLALGTAFIYRKNNKLYLVSAWHNFSGINPETKQPLSAHGGLPNKVKCRLILNEELISWSDEMFDLTKNDYEKLWMEHPTHKEKVDIGVLPISVNKKFKVNAINDYKFSDMRTEIAQDVFILGFPRGIPGRRELPIWKRGSIASEPGGNYPKILIDSATREGMSGSPVIMRYKGFYFKEPGKINNDDWMGEGDLFLGVYSGRLGKEEIKAQLGVVWKSYIIDEIINQAEELN